MSTIQACRGCLNAETTIYDVSGNNLQEMFEILTQISLKAQMFPIYFCLECIHRLRYCRDFRSKCARAEEVLMQLISSNDGFNQESIKKLDRKSLNLQTKLSTTNVYSIDITPDSFSENEIKKEPDLKTESVNENLTQEVNKSDDLQSKDDIYFDVGIVDHNSSFDDDDDMPLIRMAKDDQVKVKKERVKRSKKGFAERYANEIILTKEQQLAEMQERRNSQNYLHSPYRCEMCFKGFVEEATFRNHTEKHDKISGQYSCDVCHLRYISRRQLAGHCVSAHSRRYECAECKHRSQTANQAREHEKWHRGHKYECKQCGLTFDKPTSHLTHIRKVHRSLFYCAECGESCVSEHGLRMHRAKTVHREKDPQDNSLPSDRFCSDCGVQFLSAAAWRRHVLTSVYHKIQHKTAKNCVICKREFSTNTELQVHMRGHRREMKPPSEKMRVMVKFHCDLCSSTFMNKSKLQLHYRRVHLGLKCHRDFVCEVCGKHFKSNATLKYHHRTHTGERPYPCPECPKRFADGNQLRIHSRMHSGARPYSCTLCASTFRQKPALTRHMRVHTGAKPYSCLFCSKSFSQSNSLKLHTRTVHHKLPSNRRRAVKHELTTEQEHNVT